MITRDNNYAMKWFNKIFMVFLILFYIIMNIATDGLVLAKTIYALRVAQYTIMVAFNML